MKKFGFVSEAAKREYMDLPKDVQHDFGMSLRALQDNKAPFLPISPLKGIGMGIMELKINGSPAYRCVYIAKYLDSIIVLHSFDKTTNGVDRAAMKTVEARYKVFMQEIRSRK